MNASPNQNNPSQPEAGSRDAKAPYDPATLKSLNVTYNGPAQTIHARVASFEGPLPPPNVLVQYGEIDPSFPGRIIRMAEEAAAVERTTQIRGQKFAFYSDMTGRILGFIFASAMMGISAYLAIHGHDWVAGIMAGTTAGGITVALISGAGRLARSKMPPASPGLASDAHAP